MKRAVIYLRVSTDEQASKGHEPEGFSLPAQREACLRKAEQMEAVVVGEYRDAGESARSADRPELQAMLTRIETNRDADYVIVHKVDRLARNRYDDVTINLRLRQAGATLVSVSEGIDDSPSGQLLHAIMAAHAEFFSRNLATETHKGLSQKFKSGGTIGLAPIGYLNVGTRVDGRDVRTIEIDPDRAPLIVWAFEQYATGRYSLDRLHEALTRRGLTARPTPKRAAKAISVSTLERILKNRYYIGKVRYKGAETDGTHQPLVSRELFEKVQAVLRAHAVSGEKQRVHLHYLKGTVYCKRCGARLCLTNAKGRYLYFFCLGRQKGNGCTLPYLPAADIEDRVIDHYRNEELSPDDIEQARAAVTAYVARRRRLILREAERSQRRLPRLDAQRTKLLQAHLTGAVPLDVLAREQSRLTAEMEHAKTSIGVAEAKAEDEEQIVWQAVDLMTDWHRTYQKAVPDIRRRLNQTFFIRLRVDEHGNIAGNDPTPTYGRLRAPDLPTHLAAEIAALDGSAVDADPLFVGQRSSDDYQG